MVEEAETLGRVLAVAEAGQELPERTPARVQFLRERRAVLKEQFDRLAGMDADERVIERQAAQKRKSQVLAQVRRALRRVECFLIIFRSNHLRLPFPRRM